MLHQLCSIDMCIKVWQWQLALTRSVKVIKAPHLESGFQFAPVVIRCGWKPVSSSHPFLRAETWRTDGENPTTCRDVPHVLLRNGLRGFIPPSRYFLSILSNRLKPYASSHYPEDMLWQPKMVNCKSKKWHEQISRFLTCGGGWKGPLFRSVLPEDTTINSCSIRQPWKSVWANFWLLCWMRKTNTGITSKQEHKVC